MKTADIKSLIKKLEKLDSVEISVNREDYIKLLHEVTVLRFKCRRYQHSQAKAEE